MNFQCETYATPTKCAMINPLVPSSRLILLKILSGEIFGNNILIDVILLVYPNELSVAESLKLELHRCVFSNTNTIEISTDISSKEADFICVMTDFANPNNFDIDNVEDETRFETFNSFIKLANFLSWPHDQGHEELLKKDKDDVTKTKPIFITDGLLALDILASLSSNKPYDVLFAPTPIEAIAKSILGDNLDVQCNEINDVLVWAANDEIFHLEVEKPLIISDKVDNGPHCDRSTISKETLQSLNMDYTQFNASWMRKEYLEKVASSAARNPYGCIYKAAEFAKTLKQIWKARSGGSGMKVYSNMGVISDGSIGTLKGFPYVLPLILTGSSWVVNKRFEESTYLKQEMKRINKAVKEQHEKLISYCKKFLQDNVINPAFIPSDNESSIIGDTTSTSSIIQMLN